MVSLGGLEEEISQIARHKGWLKDLEEGPSLAISVLEKERDKPAIVLFTTLEISKEEINQALKEGGYGGLSRIAEVRRLEQIPLNGTGKTHYRFLDELLNGTKK